MVFYMKLIEYSSLNQLIAGSYQLPKGLILSDDPFIIKLKGAFSVKLSVEYRKQCIKLYLYHVQFLDKSEYQNTRLAKKFVWIFLQTSTEKPEQSF